MSGSVKQCDLEALGALEIHGELILGGSISVDLLNLKFDLKDWGQSHDLRHVWLFAQRVYFSLTELIDGEVAFREAFEELLVVFEISTGDESS